MPRIIDVIHRLLPEGSVTRADRSVSRCPDWPPDLFAVAATLIELSGLYARPRFINGWDDSYAFRHKHVRRNQRIGRRWIKSGKPPAALRLLWRALIKVGNEIVGIQPDDNPVWQDRALKLLAIADEASCGIGFSLDPTEGMDGKPWSSPFARLVFEDLREHYRQREPQILKHLPYSLGKMVPPSEVCVQPKTNLPEVGCTLRSLSHHLALLAPEGVVRSNWYFAHPARDPEAGDSREESTHFAHPCETKQGPLNLLLVPFPYVVRGLDFAAISTTRKDEHDSRYFSINPGWLKREGDTVSPQDIVEFVSALTKEAIREVDTLHGVVFPESALLDDQCVAIADGLAQNHPSLELFVAGTLPASSNTASSVRWSTRNAAFTARMYNGTVLHIQRQGKHHRWRLNRDQIIRYNLGHVLDPECDWWEQTNLSPRECNFNLVRRGASLAVLICEDLARFDPVMPVINAVGPNLVVALLMDGPQWKDRWPARYATVLADDPGSSVLTLTNLGMIRRSSTPGSTYRRTVALWKEPGKATQELDLGPADHALLISLAMSTERQQSLDLRDDGGAAVRFRLSAVHPLRISGAASDWPELG